MVGVAGIEVGVNLLDISAMQRCRLISDLIRDPACQTELLHTLNLTRGRPECGLLQQPRRLRPRDQISGGLKLLHERRVIARHQTDDHAVAVDDRLRGAQAVGILRIAPQRQFSPIVKTVAITVAVGGADAVKFFRRQPEPIRQTQAGGAAIEQRREGGRRPTR